MRSFLSREQRSCYFGSVDDMECPELSKKKQKNFSVGFLRIFYSRPKSLPLCGQRSWSSGAAICLGVLLLQDKREFFLNF